MKRTKVSAIAACAVVISAWVGTAVQAAPALPSASELQLLVDRTGPDSGNTQLSTIDSFTNLPNGVQLNVTFRVGVGTADPFDPNYGQNFARLTLARFIPAPLDWSAFTGLQFTVEHSLGGFIQPYLKTGAGFQFYEPTGGGTGIGANSPTPVLLDFAGARTFSPAFTDPVVVANTNNVREWGIQIGAGGITVGNPVQATIRITNVPEPATMGIAGVALLGIGAIRRRRK